MLGRFFAKTVSSAPGLDRVEARVAVLWPQLPWPDEVDGLGHVFSLVRRIYGGQHPHFERPDCAFFGLGSVVRATLLLLQLIERHREVGHAPQIGQRHLRLAVAASLLQDVGLLKDADDIFGTGAKHFLNHERRSAQLAGRLLTDLGWPARDVEAVQRLIRATSSRTLVDAQPFQGPAEAFCARALLTVHLLALAVSLQAPEALPRLFRDWRESFDAARVPAGRRQFVREADLRGAMVHWWEHRARPLLDGDAQGLFHHLDHPGREGSATQQAVHAIRALRQRAPAAS